MVNSVASFVALRKYSRVWSIVLLAMDILVISFSMFIANYVHILPTFVVIITALVLPVLLALTGTYQRSFAGSVRDEWYAIGAALTFVTVPLIFLTFIVPVLWYTRTAIIIFSTIAFIGISMVRMVAHYKCIPRRIAVIGITERIDVALLHLKVHSNDCILRVPIENIESTFDTNQSTPPWMTGALTWGANYIIITEALPSDEILYLSEVATRKNVIISIAPPRLRLHSYRMILKREGNLTLLQIVQLPILTPLAQIYKRTFDILFSSLAITILFPVLFTCAIAVMFETKGPIIFRQERIGKNRKPFYIMKFRSMPVDTEQKSGPIWANYKINQPTKVGKFLRRTSMDELPQFFNVLRGDMSLVGPRPEREYFIERFRASLPRYEDRLLVAPGITGWSQIGMSRMLTTEQMGLRLEGDLFYLQEWSPLLDVQILIKTFFEFLFHWQPYSVSEDESFKNKALKPFRCDK